MLSRGLQCNKMGIVLEDKVSVLIRSLFKLLPIMLVEELLGKVMYMWERLILSKGVFEVDFYRGF